MATVWLTMSMTNDTERHDDSEPKSRAERLGMGLGLLVAVLLTLAAGLEFAGYLRAQ